MRNINKLFSLLFILSTSVFYAQGLPTTPVTPGEGEGTTGTGAQSIPVDMYVYVLAAVAVMLLVFFAKKYKSQKI
ncbi:signal peptidase [Chryseobacterium caseinilyticum]|uniref:Signal peptidase n=1 Tax=Chryseobacterium caseinilyticum TaxID=2771428 RepID=A0ABR8ZDL3_9FLAO|nr:signal peptidase [Chryseobacterium caseinilyticum]MBD8083358.1 signal peptidase [Chryseobacterium caseinilyticum]